MIYRSIYYFYIKTWLDLFPREQCLILQSEYFFENPGNTLSKCFEFLGVSDYDEIDYCNANPGYYPPLSSSLRETLANFFDPYNRKLEELIEMRLSWK